MATRSRSSAGSASAAWATRWPSASPRAAPTSPSGTARAPRPSRWRRYGAKIADQLVELAACDIVFVMVSTWDDVKEVVAGPAACCQRRSARRSMVVECSSISLEGSAELRAMLAARGIADARGAGVGQRQGDQGRAAVVRVLGAEAPRSTRRCRSSKMIAPAASYVGEGELARIVKICHNVFLGVVTQSLAEITVLAQKAGVPRHAFLDFMNQSVMGSTFSRYKTPAFVNLDFKVTFTPQAAAQGPRPRARCRRGASTCRCRSPRSRATSCRR